MLILVPTSLEWRALFPELAEPATGSSARFMTRTSLGEPADVARCGLGLSASGARAAALLSRRDDDACLVGLAGTLRESLAPLGSVVVADAVQVDGIGFGLGAGFVHPSEAPEPLLGEWTRQAPRPPWAPPISGLRGGILSVAASSGTPADASRRRERFPGCLAEEMEADALLHAAAALGRRLAVVRAIGNVAGVRDASAWRVAPACAALRDALDEWLRP